MTESSSLLPKRLASIRSKLSLVKGEYFLVAALGNVAYLSGFSGDAAWLLVGRRKAWLLTDPRFSEEAGEDLAPGIGRFGTRAGVDDLAALLKDVRARKLLVEDTVSCRVQRQLLARLPGLNVDFIPGSVEELRSRKDSGELSKIRAAAALTDRAFLRLVSAAVPAVTDHRLQAAVCAEIFEGGGSPAFEPIMAVGENSSRPHARARGLSLGPGTILLCDLGARLDGYCADLSRTFCLGPPPPRFEEVHQAVADAQRTAIDRLRPGLTGHEVDAAARGLLAERGLGDYFGHGLGHGVGLDIHELPRLGPGSADVVEEGMVVTVEPGVYIPGWGGVRIEDTVLVTGTGVEVLTLSGQHPPRSVSDRR
ncbi:MAG TPA: Xaa-Pro peptidase family protein [bacterium]|nr:Xaa-Pro peptidase family protein [bacterium]HPQ66204.1 Xaa-Pro peptidase family protein [bacterium]